MFHAIQSLPTRKWGEGPVDLGQSGVELKTLGSKDLAGTAPPSTQDGTSDGTPAGSSRSGLAEYIPKDLQGFFSPSSTKELQGAPSPAPAGAYATDGAKATKECAICLTNFAPGDEVRELPCGHVFRKACIDEWLLKRGRLKPDAQQIVAGMASCPLCKVVPIEVPEPRLPSPTSTTRLPSPARATV